MNAAIAILTERLEVEQHFLEELLRSAELTKATVDELRSAIEVLEHASEPTRWLVGVEAEPEENSRVAHAQGVFDRIREKAEAAEVDVREAVDAAAATSQEDEETSSEVGPFKFRVRRWARREGYDVAAKGRIPQFIVEAYLEAHPEEVE